MANVLIIDDEELVCKILADMVNRTGHCASYAYTLKEGIGKAMSAPFDVVFLDVRLPDGNGLDALPMIREMESSPEVIIITGAGDPNGAEIAIKSDAWDYLQKPLSTNKITLQLNRVLQYRSDIEKAGRKAVALKLDGIVGNSPRIQNCFDFIAQAAITDTNVLLTGETGTGKELFARAIHDNSPRAVNNFVVVDCAALPETLAESLLFGYEKGVYTGADRSRDGMITNPFLQASAKPYPCLPGQEISFRTGIYTAREQPGTNRTPDRQNGHIS
ncbi:MAG: sigma-54-dependent Fis family transcriptional regulator [Desulfobacteraceae bacterium]|nr:sigma-54-dependent Fis family transcriptional regulator [Desulfobacteraceae bacterium]